MAVSFSGRKFVKFATFRPGSTTPKMFQTSRTMKSMSRALSDFVSFSKYHPLAFAPTIDSLPSKVNIIEVGPRDGLQTWDTNYIVPVSLKYDLISKLSDCGFANIESGAFMNPKVSLQMASSPQVFNLINQHKVTLKQDNTHNGDNNITYSALIANMKGLERCIEHGINYVTIVTSASASHCQQNINCDNPTESVKKIKNIIKVAHEHNIHVRIGMACAFGCPFEGKINPSVVCDIIDQFMSINSDSIMIADTIGIANPNTTYEMLNAISLRLGKTFIKNNLHLHFHTNKNNKEISMDNLLVGLKFGVCTYDSSVAGLGGPPAQYTYAKNCGGNIASEELVSMLDSLGIETGIDLEKLTNVSKWLNNELSNQRNMYICHLSQDLHQVSYQ